MVYIELMDKAQLPLPSFPKRKKMGLEKGFSREKFQFEQVMDSSSRKF